MRTRSEPKPDTLEAAALQAEHARHAARLREITAMAAKLRALDAYMPAVRAAGADVHPDDVSHWGWGQKRAVRICNATFNEKRNVVLERVLREQGMRETGRNDYPGGSYTVELTKGHLTVSIAVRPSACASAPASTAAGATA